MSRGQKQWLEIGVLLAQEPRLLLLDEPATGIQPNIIQQIGRVIERLREKREMAIVLVEQYFGFAHDLGDSFFVIERGAVKLSGRKDALDRETLMRSVSV